jgi:hypothetical protein
MKDDDYCNFSRLEHGKIIIERYLPRVIELEERIEVLNDCDD